MGSSLTLAIVAAAAALVACSDVETGGEGAAPTPCSAATATATTSVSIVSMQFVPFCVTVAGGAEITFTNLDTVEHSVTADAGEPEQFESGLLEPGQQFVHRFAATAETVRVHSRYHPEVTAVINVQ